MKYPKTILTKWSIRNKRILVLMFVFLNLTITQSAKTVANIIDLEGDKDGFGVGCPIANGLNFTDYGDILTDYRGPGDPNFTDNWVDGDQTWTHTYDLMGQSPLSASLEIFVAGIADNPAWNAEVLVNGVSVGTIPPETSDYDITRILTFNIPIGLLNSPDGITIDLNNDLDGYIIDYSQLSIDTGSTAPPNDACANAMPIGNVTDQDYNTTEATFDGPGGFVFTTYTGNIWYCYTATHSGTVTITLTAQSSGYDTALRVFNGCQCPTSTTSVAENDDIITGVNTNSQVQFTTVCGNQYMIEVGGYSSSKGVGKITISATGTPCSSGPANDNCSNAEVVGNVSNKTFSTLNATHDGPGGCIFTSPNIWYKYTATCTGELLIRLCGNYDTVLALYTGTSCSNMILVGCNDDPLIPFSCPSYAYQSEIKINTTAGITYWIEVGGLKSTDKGQGILTVSCGGQAQEASDLGDAPDNTNHYPSSNMRTYDHLAQAKFPTVFEGYAIKGPIHLNPKTVAYLGSTVTFEDEADQGYDEDPTNNIIPLQLNSNADRDLGDDGVIMSTDPYAGKTLGMNHCQLTAFDYNVNVIDPNVDMYVNVWFDWNRDGDWEDDGLTDINLNCASCNTSGVVQEWAVQNQLLYDLNIGLNTITTPGFLAWYPATGDEKIWMRITISEEPWKGGTGAAGSGPANGYDYGETEDYYFTPIVSCIACEDLNRDGIVDELDLFTYMLNWLDNCLD